MSGLFDHKYPITNLHELDLSWVIMKVKEIELTLNEWTGLIDELREGLEHLREVEEDINALDARVEALEVITADLNRVYAAIDALAVEDTKLWAELAGIKQSIINLEIALRNEIENFRTYIDNKVTAERIARINGDYQLQVIIRDLDRQLSAQIDYINYRLDQLIPVDVYNRVAGVRLNFDTNNFNIYEDLRDVGISNALLSEYGISNDHVASLHMNNRDYAINAFKRFKLYYMFSPVSGVRKSHSNALSEVLALLAGGVDNDDLYGQMASDDATNDDIGNYYASNLLRYAASI